MNPEVGLWTELIKRSELEMNRSGDVILKVESYKEPLKEILQQDHIYNENAKDIFFMEVTIKNSRNFVNDVRHAFPPLDISDEDFKEYTICIRAFSLTRNIWIKDYQSLVDIIRLLKREKYLTNEVKLIYYSMLRDAAVLLSHKMIFSEEAKTAEFKKRTMVVSKNN